MRRQWWLFGWVLGLKRGTIRLLSVLMLVVAVRGRCCDSWHACNVVLKLLVKKSKERQKRNIPKARDKQRLKPRSLIDLPVTPFVISPHSSFLPIHHFSPFIISPPLSNAQAVVGVQDLTHH